jgi:hypothetical protein
MYRSTKKPCTERSGQGEPEGETPGEAEIGNGKEENGGDDTPQYPFGKVRQQPRIAGLVGMEPDKDNQAGKRHGGNQPPQVGYLFPTITHEMTMMLVISNFSRNCMPPPSEP